MRDEEHLLHREGGDAFLEDTFISSLLRRDGEYTDVPLSYKEDIIDTRVQNYLKADMVNLNLPPSVINIYNMTMDNTSKKLQCLVQLFLPINIKDCHWYLAVVNAKVCEIHVLDSFGLELLDRRDLTFTVSNYSFFVLLVFYLIITEKSYICIKTVTWTRKRI